MDLENETTAQPQFGPDTKSKTFSSDTLYIVSGNCLFHRKSAGVLDALGLVSAALNHFD